eukprot:6056419-Pleurochrysis_carterae.AAC.1
MMQPILSLRKGAVHSARVAGQPVAARCVHWPDLAGARASRRCASWACSRWAGQSRCAETPTAPARDCEPAPEQRTHTQGNEMRNVLQRALFHVDALSYGPRCSIRKENVMIGHTQHKNGSG